MSTLYNISRCKVCNMRGQQAGENLWKYGVCDACESHYPENKLDAQLHQERIAEACAMNPVTYDVTIGRWDFAQNPTPIVSKADRSWKNV
jgi:hypothetical protein